MKHIFLSLLLGFILIACGARAPKEEVRVYDIPVDSFTIDTSYVKSGQTMGAIFAKAGASREQQVFLTSLKRSEFDTRSIRPDKQYITFCQSDEQGQHLKHLVYIPSVREAYVFHMQDSFYVDHIVKPVDTVARSVKVGIESSLWNAMVDNNISPEVALELSEIYAWTIDFFGLQKGDSVSVYFDEYFVDDTPVGLGRIHAATFYHGKQWQEAYYFKQGTVANYFDAQGNSLRKAFLKAPLNYKRISSTFTYARKHPIYKIVRPHTGVDYAAPAGTPVVALGDGVVTMKQYKGGGGNTIKIKHNATYTTGYMHLKGYAKGLAVGKRVKQGEVIGYVGSTGSSTGPHLDFRVWKNGTPIDPLKMVSPPAEPVPAQYKAAYSTKVAEYKQKLL